MTRLSVNINKVATLRNARGGDMPNILQVAKDCEKFGAEGITIHPRPDERHIRYQDARELAPIITTEFNIEGNPTPSFIDLVMEVCPTQVTLVPDAPDALTSNAGWNVAENFDLLQSVIKQFNTAGIRTSIFVGTACDNIQWAAKTGCKRIELFTEPYAKAFGTEKQETILKDFIQASAFAHSCGLEVNAGHDLNLENLNHFARFVKPLHEVSIGHALICDALYMGLESTIQQYRKQLIIE